MISPSVITGSVVLSFATFACIALAGVAKADSFTMTPNAGIPEFNRETHKDVTVATCQSLCLDRPWCKSADYGRATGKCFLQRVNRFDQALRTDYPGHPYDHYHRNSKASVQVVVSGERVSSVFWGRSFLTNTGPGIWEERSSSGAVLDFTFTEIYRNAYEIVLNDPSRDVDLRINLNRMTIDYADANNPDYRQLYKIEGVIDVNGKQHPVTVATTPSPRTDTRFDLTRNAGIPGFNSETHTGQSVQACLNLCAERSWCKSADFERATGQCFLQPVNKLEQSLRTDYPDNSYDHYHLKTTTTEVDDGYPDRSQPWASDFGPIHWKEGYYGNPSKIIEGTLRSHGSPQYIFEGFWQHSDTGARGSVLFVFSADGKRFEGTYTDSHGRQKPWNGFRQH